MMVMKRNFLITTSPPHLTTAKRIREAWSRRMCVSVLHLHVNIAIYIIFYRCVRARQAHSTYHHTIQSKHQSISIPSSLLSIQFNVPEIKKVPVQRAVQQSTAHTAQYLSRHHIITASQHHSISKHPINLRYEIITSSVTRGNEGSGNEGSG